MSGIDEQMKCDICKSDQLQVLVLRKHRFTLKGKRLSKKVSRVCFSCGRRLISRKEYSFGVYWSMIFYFYSRRK